MNTNTDPLTPRDNTPLARVLFLVAAQAERSLLSRIFHELADFCLMAELLHYEGQDYQDALRDHLNALIRRYDAAADFTRELPRPAVRPDRTDNKETRHDDP